PKLLRPEPRIHQDQHPYLSLRRRHASLSFHGVDDGAHGLQPRELRRAPNAAPGLSGSRRAQRRHVRSKGTGDLALAKAYGQLVRECVHRRLGGLGVSGECSLGVLTAAVLSAPPAPCWSTARGCPFWRVKQTSRQDASMSAIGPKRTFAGAATDHCVVAVSLIEIGSRVLPGAVGA